MRLRLCLPASVALAVLVFLAPTAFAQGTISLAQLNGTVQDTSGRSIAKAQVTLREVDTNRTYTATTNDAGFYVSPRCPPEDTNSPSNIAGLRSLPRQGSS
jgi:hypothetical protein